MSESTCPANDFDPAVAPVEPGVILIVRPPVRSRLAATLPPLLLLLSALALTAYQFRPHSRVAQRSSVTNRRIPRVPVEPVPVIDDGQVVLAGASVQEPPDEPNVESPVLPVEEPSSIEPIPPPAPQVRPIAKIVREEIDAEVVEARIEQAEAAGLRGEVFTERQDALIARLDKARLDATDDRGAFHAELNQAIRRHGRKAGATISQLASAYGREVDPEIHRKAEELRARLDRIKASPEARVREYRRIGMPEPCILDELARLHMGTIGSRRGPRNGQEVLYFAAKKLVSIRVQ